MIVIGADTHKSTHTLAALDAATGGVVATRTVAADRDGMLAAWRWAHRLDGERVWAIEDCRHVSGRVERCLIGRGERAVRVAPKLMGQTRRGERRPGKSDEIDAIAVARAALQEGVETLPIAFLDEPAFEIRLLSITAPIWSPSAPATRTGCAGTWSSLTPSWRPRCPRARSTATAGLTGSPAGWRRCHRPHESGSRATRCDASASSPAPNARSSAT